MSHYNDCVNDVVLMFSQSIIIIVFGFSPDSIGKYINDCVFSIFIHSKVTG